MLNRVITFATDFANWAIDNVSMLMAITIVQNCCVVSWRMRLEDVNHSMPHIVIFIMKHVKTQWME